MGNATNDHDHRDDAARASSGGSAQEGSYVDDDVASDGVRTGGPHDGELDGTYTEEAVTSEGDGSYVDADVPDEATERGGPHDGEADGSFTQADLGDDD